MIRKVSIEYLYEQLRTLENLLTADVNTSKSLCEEQIKLIKDEIELRNKVK